MRAEVVPLWRRELRWRRVVVLTGAGISVGAGLPTYRGPGGLWESEPELAKALVAGVAPALLWRTLGAMRSVVARAEPSPAHLALARFERDLEAQGGSFTLLTQNVDALHQRAGSRNVIELHGRLGRTRCTACSLPPFDDTSSPSEVPPCLACGAPLRPDVVLFEEPLGADEEVGAKRALRGCDLFVAIGTSGTVWPAASYVRSAEYEGAHTVLVDLVPPPSPNPSFRELVVGPADEVVPALFAAAS
jgi:NAD-dependent deacetylase